MTEPSELLRRAAVRLREGSPLVSPVVAEPLTRELEMHAAWLGPIEERDGDRGSMGHALAVERAGHMLAFARSILEQP